MNETSKIRHVSIEDAQAISSGGLIARDRNIALTDLQRGSVFQPVADENGPYDLALSVEENRLVFRITNAAARPLPALALSLKPYSRLIKDYFIIVDSYNEAIKGANPSRIEAIDMGRRGLHNEGASLLQERLEDKISMDQDTARRLFTLICILYSEKIIF
ncbi:MAG: UPF0262 family protein [Alphaproteobacteria bacterium]|nr:UPF0262 family protein [Alphaproteobacteria bacterium]